MSKKENKTEWHIVYRKIAEVLFQFYIVNENAGEKLYNKLIGNKDFVEINNWINKYSLSPKTKSIDPIQIFSSFNGNKQKIENRIDRINTFFKVMRESQFYIKYDNIDFYGCPAPVTINLISSRNISEQNEIWNSFASVFKNRKKGLTEDIYTKASIWYGIGQLSFTQFLFWIDSENFIPLDKNTISFLLSYKKIIGRPSNYKEYYSLLELENTNVYRELTATSYDFFVNSISNQILSTDLNNYLNASNTINNIKLDFKLVAIRPLNGIDKNLLKVLTKGKLYKFYNNYNFSDDFKIVKFEKNEVNPYKIEGFPNINISAIVGKNGKGKSTITELLYIAIYNISLKKNLINQKLKNVRGLSIEIYFQTDFFYKVILKNGEIEIERFETIENEYLYPKRILFEEFSWDHFFYTIAVNYSHYGLNSTKFDYDWITPLSHKNDGYQTPIVINPMRTQGNFDINVEDELLQARLLSNILEPIDENDSNSLRDITFERRVKTLKLKCIENKTKFKYDGITLKDERKKYILDKVYNFFKIERNQNIPYQNTADQYIIKKIFNITSRYSNYFKYYSKSDHFFNDKQFDDLLKEIDKDSSHITFKLKQAINYLKYNPLKNFISDENYESILINIEKLSSVINTIKSINTENKLSTIELIPPSFFSCEILFEDGSSIKKMSSGENQLINILSSITYHINNIDSVIQKKNVFNYGYINIVLDEVELYFHPDMQRKLLSHLFNYLCKLDLEKINGINICFITHSPFILSDIIDDNILFLGDTKNEKRLTFGSNLFDLLSDSFFLEDGFVGEFAKIRIQEIIDYLNDKNDTLPIWLKSNLELKLFIDKIGEPFLREKLKEMYISRFYNEYKNEIIDSEINELNKKLKELQKIKVSYGSIK